MKKWQMPWFSRLTEVLLWVMMAVDTGLMISLPWLVPAVTDQQRGDKLYADYLIILYISGFMALLVIGQCLKLFRNMNGGNAFSDVTVHCLRVVGVECLILSVLYIAAIVFLHVVKFFLGLLAVVYGFIGLMAFVFAALFCEAQRCKAENDKTV